MSWWWNSPLVYVQNNLQFRNNMLAIYFIWCMEWRRSNIIYHILIDPTKRWKTHIRISYCWSICCNDISVFVISYGNGIQKIHYGDRQRAQQPLSDGLGTSLPAVSDSTNTTHTNLSRFCRKESYICRLVKTSLPLWRRETLVTKRSLCVNHYLLWNLPPLY